MNNLVLSLCIPTNGALNWVLPVIDSIYAQGCDDALFEVIVSDNAKNAELQQAIEDYGRDNLYYYPSDAKGFLNIVSSFKKAKGDYCKLINHRAKIVNGALKQLLALVERYKYEQPVIYCTNGVLGSDKDEIYCKDINELVWNLHYFCSWMAGIGIWRKDIPNLEGIKYNELFPNTTILFEQRTAQSAYLLWNGKFFNEQSGRGKGCYNLFHTFAVVFPDMLKDLKDRGRITPKAFDKVLADLYGCLKGFYRNLVINDPDTSFDLTGIRKNLAVYYPWYTYYKIRYEVFREMSWREIHIYLGAKKNEMLRKIGISEK